MKGLKNLKRLTIAALFLLTGCASFPVLSPKQTPVAPPANAQQPCDEVPDLPPSPDMGDLANYVVNLVALYGECALRHDALIKATEK